MCTGFSVSFQEPPVLLLTFFSAASILFFSQMLLLPTVSWYHFSLLMLRFLASLPLQRIILHRCSPDGDSGSAEMTPGKREGISSRIHPPIHPSFHLSIFLFNKHLLSFCSVSSTELVPGDTAENIDFACKEFTVWHCGVHCGSHQPHVALEHLKCGQSEMRCAVGPKHTSDFEHLAQEKECEIAY